VLSRDVFTAAALLKGPWTSCPCGTEGGSRLHTGATWKTLLVGVGIALFGASPASAATYTTQSVADTAIRYGTKQGDNYGTTGDMYIRQLDGNGSGAPIRDFIAYTRFNLDDIPDPNGLGIRITGVTITFTKVDSERTDTVNAARFQLSGLNNVSGNTSQVWDETVLTWNNAGDEKNPGIYPAPALGLSPLDSTSRTTLFVDGAGVTESIINGNWKPADGDPNGSVSVTGDGLTSTCDPDCDSAPVGPWYFERDPLAQFVQDRLDDDGNVTFITDMPTHGNNSKGVGFGTNRQTNVAYQPTLTVTYGLVPEPSTGLLLAAGLLGLGMADRKFKLRS